MMEKLLYPNHPVSCVITGPSECGKSVLLTKIISNNINEHEKLYIYSPSLHQDLYQKLNICFITFIAIHIIPNILIEEHIDVVIDEVVNDKNFQKSNTEIETYESIEELKYPKEYNSDQPIVIILDYLNQNEKDDSRVQSMYKRSRHKHNSIFLSVTTIKSLVIRLSVLIVISSKFSNRTISEMFKISIKIKQAWT